MVLFVFVQLLLLGVFNLHLNARVNRFRQDVAFHNVEASKVPDKEREYGAIKRKLSRVAMTNAVIQELVTRSGLTIYRDAANPRFSTLVLANQL